MYKSCSKCGRIHDTNYKCHHSVIRKQTDESKLRNTYDWHSKSWEIREQANFLCEVCRDQGVYNYHNLEVHHIVKLKDNKDLLLDDDNLICLCQEHHKQADAGELSQDYLRELVKKRSPV